MSKKDKMVARLMSRPKDYSYDELVSLLGAFGMSECNKGKTSGSRVMFSDEEGERVLRVHKPHPRNELPGYQIKQIIEFLSQEGLI